ncbi:MAG: DUF6285 domain-containing protein [Solirubrobacteraceae bacterium]|jgi:hypothetical protein
MQDRPDAPELAAAVSQFLAEQVRPAVPAELRFLVLVAANACAILAREIQGMSAEEAAEARRLLALATGADAGAGAEVPPAEDDIAASQRRLAWSLRSELARRIRAGQLDERWDDAVRVVRDSVRAKLAVAHPGYDDFADDGGPRTT